MNENASRILIVEDDTLQAAGLSEALASAGFMIVGIADNCAAALSVASRNRPDLALVDVKLSGNIDGITTGRQLFEEYGIPVVFLTAFLDDAVQQGRQFARGFLNKPYSADDVVSTIRRALAG